MRCNSHWVAALATAAFVTSALAGGSNYGITPGTLPNFSGKVTKWPAGHDRMTPFKRPVAA